jgi:hypothetical protein
MVERMRPLRRAALALGATVAFVSTLVVPARMAFA